MKQPAKILAVLVLLLLTCLAIWVGFSPIAPRRTASVILVGVTNNASGQQVALLCFANASSVGVVGIAHSVDYKTADGWLTQQPVPAVVTADVASSTDLGPHGSRIASVRFPTNGTWRLRIRYHEQPRGAEGVFARVRDLINSLRDRVRHTSYTGQSYLAETVEITQ